MSEKKDIIIKEFRDKHGNLKTDTLAKKFFGASVCEVRKIKKEEDNV